MAAPRAADAVGEFAQLGIGFVVEVGDTRHDDPAFLREAL
jgi:hypothetical protein